MAVPHISQSNMTAKPIKVGMNEKVECAETLPSRFYTDPAILALEKEQHLSADVAACGHARASPVER